MASPRLLRRCSELGQDPRHSAPPSQKADFRCEAKTARPGRARHHTHARSHALLSRARFASLRHRADRFLFQSVFAQPAIELGSRQSQPLGGARLVAAALAEHLDDRRALNRAQIGGGRSSGRRFRSAVGRQMRRADRLAVSAESRRVRARCEARGRSPASRARAAPAGRLCVSDAGTWPNDLPISCSIASLSGRMSARRSRSGAISMSNTCSR